MSDKNKTSKTNLNLLSRPTWKITDYISAFISFVKSKLQAHFSVMGSIKK